jgi:antitoxin CptB
MGEEDEIRLRRLRLRSWRRGTREMDLILGAFADAELPRLDAAELDIYESLLSENDHDLYGWIAGNANPPDAIRPMLGRIRQHVLAGRGPGTCL